MFRVCSECAQSVFRVCSECAQSVFRVYSECAQKSVLRMCSECVQSVFRVCSILKSFHHLAHLVCQFLAFFVYAGGGFGGHILSGRYQSFIPACNSTTVKGEMATGQTRKDSGSIPRKVEVPNL